ncbi:glucuronate isomerase [Oscillospiraceae bacterium MB08-C2-2]|nr:glucuronate isomerase [Oscillospiraceae bacterium MB08-C2-2]
MRAFLDENFLLRTPTAINLFQAVKDLPIVDYHCHLIPQQIAENKRFANITEIWLGGDHYKWRLMRANGVEERFITGDAPDFEKFQKWCETIEICIGSPLYHWTHLELKRYFDYHGLLSGATAKEAWDHCNAVLAREDFCVWDIFKKFHVETLCTTDDPADTLEYHKQISAGSGTDCKVLPTFRPGVVLEPGNPGFIPYLDRLSKVSGASIGSFAALAEALCGRVEYFHSLGGRLSDHALDGFVFRCATADELEAIFKKAVAQESICQTESAQFKTELLLALGRKYAEMGWSMQLHFSALRNNNSRMFKVLGADTGFDSVSDEMVTTQLSAFLDALDQDNLLPKTILYSLNANANDALATMMGNFQGGGIKGKIQLGSAWWFNDTKSGMEAQMTTVANQGLLAHFVGMLTDSRSFLSYTRHEYFRRILCNLIGDWVENGEFPADMERLTNIVKNISYYNAANYFGF